VAVNAASPTPDTIAWAELAPGVGPRVQVVEAWPLASVGPVLGSSVPPPPVTTQVTAAPTTGLPPASTTETTSGWGSASPGAPSCSLPETICTPDAVPAVAVWVKVSGEPASPSEDASVVWTPEVGPSVRVTEVSPRASVVVLG
jgi:hypothetical protein